MQFAPLLWHPNTTDDVFVFTAVIVCERKDTKGLLLKWYHWTQSQVTTADKGCEKKKGCICIDSVLLWSLVFTGFCQFLPAQLWMRARPIICRWDSQLILRHDSGSDSDTSAHLALTVNTRRNMRYNKPTVIISAEIGQRRIYFSVDISRQLNSETQTC